MRVRLVPNGPELGVIELMMGAWFGTGVPCKGAEVVDETMTGGWGVSVGVTFTGVDTGFPIVPVLRHTRDMTARVSPATTPDPGRECSF
jgi:hypothetical protein